MKKFLKPVLIIGFLALFVSCTSDDNKGGDPDRDPDPVITEFVVPKSMSIVYSADGNTSEYYHFEYLENSNFISKTTISYGDLTTESGTLDYENNKLTKMHSFFDGESGSMNFFYNADDKITSIISSEEDASSLFFTYNSNGLISSVSPDDENNPVYFSFSHNNSKSIIQSEILYLGEPIGYSSTYEYDNKQTPFKNTNIKFDLSNYDFLSLTMFNQENPHNVTKTTTPSYEEEDTVYTYEYTYDSQGYPLKVVKTEVGVGIENTITYEYTTITLTK